MAPHFLPDYQCTGVQVLRQTFWCSCRQDHGGVQVSTLQPVEDTKEEKTDVC